MITKDELLAIKSRAGALKAHHQKIRALSENAYRLCAHDVGLLIAAIEPLLKPEPCSKDTVVDPTE
jgi:hypothetical protein